MNKEAYDQASNPLKKACLNPERYYAEIMESIRRGECIAYPNYVAFTTTPVMERIQQAPEADKIELAKYLFKNTHSDLEVNNITELPMAQVKAIKKSLNP